MTSIHPRNDSTNRFPLFKEIFGNIAGCNVFDYGGGSGNLLYFSKGEITEENYTCLDVSESAIQSGKLEFPTASWAHYNKFNWMYNLEGNTELGFPHIDPNQDFIWSYSVFSHVDACEFLETVEWLCSFNYKKIAVSFLDIDGQEMKQYFFNKRVSDYGNCNDELLSISSSTANTAYFFDNTTMVIDKYRCEHTHTKHFLSFFSKKWLINELSKRGINVKIVNVIGSFVPFLLIERPK